MKVVWFDAAEYSRLELEKLNDMQKHRLAIESVNALIWEDIKSFQNDLNDDFVNIECGFIYFIQTKN